MWRSSQALRRQRYSNFMRRSRPWYARDRHPARVNDTYRPSPYAMLTGYSALTQSPVRSLIVLSTSRSSEKHWIPKRETGSIPNLLACRQAASTNPHDHGPRSLILERVVVPGRPHPTRNQTRQPLFRVFPSSFHQRFKGPAHKKLFLL